MPPGPLAADLRVVDALHAAAADHAAPAVVGRDAAADVVGTALARLHRPVGVGEHLAGEQDRVGLVGGQDVLRDARVRDAPDEQDGLRRDLLDGLRVAALPARLVGHRGVDEGVMDARRQVDVVEIDRALEVGDDALDVLELEIAGPERGGVDAVAEERVVSDRVAHALHRLDREAQAVLVGAAPAVAAVVVERREELPGQVAVRHVVLDAVQAGRHGTARGVGVGDEDLLDLVLLELLRHRRVRVLAGRHLAGRHHVPLGVEVVGGILLQHGHGAQARVQQLARQLAAVAVHRLGHAGEAVDLVVLPEPGEVELRVERLGMDDRAADDDQPAAATGALLVVGHGLVGEDPLVGIGHPGRAGGREDDPVGDRRRADLPLREEPRIGGNRRDLCHRRPPALVGVRPAQRRRALLRRGLSVASATRRGYPTFGGSGVLASVGLRP